MKTNEIYRISVIDTNENGVGIAKIENAVVFINGLVSGDIANIRITELKKNYALAECVRLIESSENRITHLCPFSGDCGGCTLDFVTYEHENEIKKNTVKSAFRRSRLPYNEIADTVCGSSRTRYRNKIVLHYSTSTSSFGLCREGSRDVLPFYGCLLCSDNINKIIKFANAHTDLLEECNPSSLQLRESSNGNISLSVHMCATDSPKFRDLMMREFPQIEQVNFACTGKKVNAERHYETDELIGLKLIFSTDGFRQVNDEVFGLMIELVRELAMERDFSTVLDLYCGSGVIGLSLAKHFPNAYFYGIEINSESVKDARLNAKQNDLSNIEFFCGDAAEFKSTLPSGRDAELVIVDPPRAGLSDSMRSELISLSAERIIYVSCNPQTLARDLADLTKNGYKIKKAIPLNMFPMTKHCETVCLLEKNPTSLCDMHTHSNCSDGSLSPEELIELAEESGLKAIALCDHNTICGLKRFTNAASKSKVIAVPGVEITTDYKGNEVHILGLFLREKSYGRLTEYLETMNRRKEENNKILARRLYDSGYMIDYAEIKRDAGGAVPNRVHFANALIKKGYVSSISEAFGGILSKNGNFYTPTEKLDALDTIKFLASINALPVIAHPLLNLSYEMLCDFLLKAKKCGLVGIETIYPLFSESDTAFANELADKFGLIKSGGSDFHGSNKPDIKIGVGKDNIAVPYQVYEKLKKAAEKT